MKYPVSSEVAGKLLPAVGVSMKNAVSAELVCKRDQFAVMNVSLVVLNEPAQAVHEVLEGYVAELVSVRGSGALKNCLHPKKAGFVGAPDAMRVPCGVCVACAGEPDSDF